MLKVERTYLNLILVVSALAALFLLSQSWKNQLLVQKVDVYDAHLVSGSEVKSLADIRPGSPLYKLSLLKIEKRVERSPFVARAVVVRALPYDVAITVKEHDPIAVVATPTATFSVDRRGVILPLPMERKNNMPVITNVMERLQVGDTAKGALMQAVQFVSDAEKFGPALSANIGEVRLDHGDLIAYTTGSSLRIIVGRNDFYRKLLYLQKFLKDVADKGNSHYSYVDLRFNGQIVVGKGSADFNRQLAMLGSTGKEN